MKLRPQPAHETLLLLRGALVVEGDEALEDLLVGQSRGPAVGVEDGGVEVVMDLLQDGDEPLLVDDAVFFGERLAGAELFQHVVYAGKCEIQILNLLMLAMRVEGFTKIADMLSLLFCAGRKGKGIEYSLASTEGRFLLPF